MTTDVSKKRLNKVEVLSTEELEQALRKRYEIGEGEFRAKAKNSTQADSNVVVDKVANNAVGIIIAVIILAALFFIFIVINNSSYSGYNSSSSSSSKTDWNAYCRDMFPNNDEYSRAARKGCINGAKTTGDLMDGKYNR